MKTTLKRTLSLLLALCLALAAFGCARPQEEPETEPSVSVINAVSCYDVDPAILIKGDKVTFDAMISGGDISFAGAFRNLTVRDLNVIDNTTVLLTTLGSVYADDAVGSLCIGKSVNSTNEDVYVDTILDRSAYGQRAVTAGFFTDLGLGLLKGLIVTGVGKAFGYGLDKLLYDKLGLDITTMASIRHAIEELSRKIDALSAQMTEMEANLTDVINESTKQILTNEYLNTFENLHSLITSIKTDTVKLWNDIETIQSTADSTSEEYRTLVIADLLTFSELEGKSVSPLVTNVLEAISYLDGSYFSLNPESLYYRILKVGCTRSVFEGEAAVLVADYLNTVNAIISEALNVMVLVCQAKYYTHRQLNVTEGTDEYKDVITFVDGQAVETKEPIVDLQMLAETDEDLRIRLTPAAVTRYKDKANGAIWQNHLTQFADFATRLFDSKNKSSLVSRYNAFVVDNCYSYNRSYTVHGEYIDVDFVRLKPSIACTGTAECGVWGSWTDSNYRTKSADIDAATRYYLHQCMSQSELDTFIRRLMSNESGLLFGESNTEQTYTIADVLRLYGFSNPSGELFPTGSTVDTSRGRLTFTGYPASASVSVNRNGEIVSSTVTPQEFKYYDYKDVFEKRYYFNYFVEETLIYTVDDLVDFLEDVADGAANKNARLMADLDVSGVDWAVVWPTAKAGNEFRGTFDGGSHKITNLRYSEGANSGAPFGLFRTLGQDAVIRDLTFEHVSVNCPASDSVGVCAGVLKSITTLSNVRIADGTVTGASNVGGIVGCAEYPIALNSCRNGAAVTGANYVGGLVGRGQTGGEMTFNSCVNSGEITAATGKAGGLIGHADDDVKLSKSTNSGRVHAFKEAGGLIGSLGLLGENGSVFRATGSVNNGAVVSDTTNAGGLAGTLNSMNLTVSGCQNYGTVTGKSAVGGLIGKFNNARRMIEINSFQNSGNYADITGEDYVGGLLGYGFYLYAAETVNCANEGNITATVRSAGGLIGETADTFMYGSSGTTNTGTVTGARFSGATVGYDAKKTPHSY